MYYLANQEVYRDIRQTESVIMKEEAFQVQKGNTNDANCDVCFIRTLNSSDSNIALYLCYMCNKYLCQDCFKGHESHRYIKKGENDIMKKYLQDEMMKETSEIEVMLDREEISMIDRVNVQTKLDIKDCGITAICGLIDALWVICDNRNSCIKIFNVGSNILQRYIRFVQRIHGVTEIKLSAIKTSTSVNPVHTKQVVTSDDNMSVTNLSKPDKPCFLAITCPFLRRIVFIDISQNPAIITKSVKTEKSCFSIDFSEDRLFTLCRVDFYKDDGYPWYVSVMSTDGVEIKKIDTKVHSRWPYPYLAVCSGLVYMTDPDKSEIFCEIKYRTKLTFNRKSGSKPGGISADPDTNKVYMCVWGSDSRIYRLDRSGTHFDSLVDLKALNLVWPEALCVQRDKLYVGHGPAKHKNFIDIVRVL